MRKKTLVSVVVVNWNGGEVFKNCLLSLSKINYPNWELIVVDNASSDASEKFHIKNLKYKLIKNQKNLGFAPANNKGYENAKGEYILFLNNDTIVKPDLISSLVSFMENDSSIGVVQPKIKFMDKPEILDNVGSFLTSTGFLTHVGFGEKDTKKFNEKRQIFTAKGACMMVRRSLIEKIGLFDRDFVSYFEESDFCFRVWLAGFKVFYYPKTSILHKVGYSSERLVSTEVNYHSFKNRISSLIKNLSSKELLKILPVHIAIVEALSFYYLFSLKYAQFLMIQRAIYWNVVNINKTLDKRSKVQKIRVVDDKYLNKIIIKEFDFKKMFIVFNKVNQNFISKKIAKNEEVLEIGRLKECLSIIKNLKIKNKTIVDIGCSTGLVISKINNEGAKKILGIDPSKQAILYARDNVKNAEFIVSDANSVPIKNGEADIVIMFDVIEHVPNGTEIKSLLEVKRILKNKGKFLLSTPNSNFFTNLLDPAWYLGHRHYSVSEIKKMIKKSGLKINKIYIKGSIWSSIYMLWFYVMKWIFNRKFPRNSWLEKKEDEGYKKEGVFTLFVEASN